MDPTAPEPAAAVAPAAEPLSPEAAWGLRAVMMVLMFLLRWIGSGSSPTAAESTEPEHEPALPDPQQRVQRAQRVAKSTAVVTNPRPESATATAVATRGASSANRKRALYASAVTAAGTAAWVAGRRSGGRR